MDLLDLWQKKHDLGCVRFDADLLVIKPTVGKGDPAWGTVFYSSAREEYKTKIKAVERSPSFDLKLMENLELTEFNELIIAANPNSLFRGHLVIYPKLQSSRLNLQDLLSISDLARQQPSFTFIHNMKNSAASIIDWAHFQAYYLQFPIQNEALDLLQKRGSRSIMRTHSDFPVYALVADGFSSQIMAEWLLDILELLLDRGGPHGQPVPCNILWQNDCVWVIPRSVNQTQLASKYFGGLEMGGLFCLPNADEFRSYLPDAIKKEIFNSTLSSEPETRIWFENFAIPSLCKSFDAHI